MTKCRNCDVDLDDTNKANQGRSGRICKECFKVYSREHLKKRYKANPAHYQLAQREYTQRLKLEVLTAYSPENCCSRCGIKDIRVLSIDHIDGGGTQHRKEIKRSSGKSFYNWLKKEHFPLGFQVLCMNCQFIKRYECDELKNQV